MLFLISPAKSLDLEATDISLKSKPRLLADSTKLIKNLRQKSHDDIKSLMHLSDNLAALNVERYKSYSLRYSDEIGKQAVLAFKGDVYQGMDVSDFDDADFEYAQQHLRILSGLYGLLKPMDMMQPYRLEMGTRLANDNGTNLYKFWDDKITKLVNKDLKASGSQNVINLASNEYFKSIQKKEIKGNLYNVKFLDEKNGQYKVISFFAKKARGMMCRFAIKHKISNPEDLKGFDLGGYAFSEEMSVGNDWTFIR